MPLTTHLRLSRTRLMIAAGAVVAVGVFVVYRSFAATELGSLAGEAMALPASGGAIVPDAGATSGRALKLTAPGSATGNLSTTARGTTVALRAKAALCDGAPQARITLDGKDAIVVTVSATSWTNYPAVYGSAAGLHTVTVELINPHANAQRGGCLRTLYVDQIEVLNSSTPAASPASPTPVAVNSSGAPVATSLATPTPTPTSSAKPTPTPTAKLKVKPTSTPKPTVTVAPSSSPTSTFTPMPTPTPAPTPTPPPPAILPNGPSGNWNLTFDDEFNGTSLDLTKWSPNWFGEGGQMNNVGTYAANATVTGGNLVLQLSSSTAGALVHTGYSAGRYQLPVGGYAEARIYFPGTSTEPIYDWPAWWASGPSWPAAGEHDIAEGLSGKLTVNYHSPSGAHNFGVIAGTWYNAFHTYGVYRKATSAEVYWDGTLVKSYSTDDNGVGEELILNIGASGSRPVQLGAAGAIKIDYVRAWNSAP